MVNGHSKNNLDRIERLFRCKNSTNSFHTAKKLVESDCLGSFNNFVIRGSLS